MWVCLCKGVTDHEIRDLLRSPLINDVDDVGAACGAGTGCGTCRDEIRSLCEEARLEKAACVGTVAGHPGGDADEPVPMPVAIRTPSAA